MSRQYQRRQTRYDVSELLASPLIKLITGPRRVGKSVFALLMLRDQPFAYLNFDDGLLLDTWDEERVMSTLTDIYGDYRYLLLDEVQNLDGWDLWVAKLYRRGVNLVITGSNANMLSSEMATVLTGRYLQVEMLPFSLSETVAWNHDTATDGILDDYLTGGGFPETLKNRSLTQNYLSTLFDSILLKDVAHRHNIRNTADLYTLAKYLLANFCNPFTANELTTELGLSSVATVKKFISYLHEPYLFYYLPRFNNKMKLMSKAAQKCYVVDNGFVTGASFNIGQNRGRLLENLLFVELLRQGYEPGKTLFYYRSRNDKEVDFVLRRGVQVEQLIQVCYDLASPKTRTREIQSLTECAEELHCSRQTIVTYNHREQITYKEHTINAIPITEYCLSEEVRG
jgi:predicted AAA+ superfamily ATPase